MNSIIVKCQGPSTQEVQNLLANKLSRLSYRELAQKVKDMTPELAQAAWEVWRVSKQIH